jgi:D-xylono/L-arabinono-1,4-lactonase
MDPELIADYACENAEGPLWHAAEGHVYWTDIPRGRIFRYNPSTNKHEPCFEGDTVGGFTVQHDGALLLFMAKGAIKLLRNGELTTVVEEIPDERGTRFNDVIADPRGRVFCGTMPSSERLGRLYRLDLDGKLVKILDGIAIPNGMGFTPDRKKLYFTESDRRLIHLLDYDEESGSLSNSRIFAQIPDGEGVPDGLTVDEKGHVWSGRWDGGCLVRYKPNGVEDRRIRFPARKVTAVTFGGPDYSDMYVTTAFGHKKANDGPGAGALFRLRLGIRGVPEFLSRISAG